MCRCCYRISGRTDVQRLPLFQCAFRSTNGPMQSHKFTQHQPCFTCQLTLLNRRRVTNIHMSHSLRPGTETVQAPRTNGSASAGPDLWLNDLDNGGYLPRSRTGSQGLCPVCPALENGFLPMRLCLRPSPRVSTCAHVAGQPATEPNPPGIHDALRAWKKRKTGRHPRSIASLNWHPMCVQIQVMGKMNLTDIEREQLLSARQRQAAWPVGQDN